MLQGVLRKLQAQGAFHIFHSGAVNTFASAGAYPVTLRPGIFTVRDVINICCQASPSATFRLTGSGLVSIGDVLDRTPRASARPGSLLFWRLGMGQATDAEPTRGQLLHALASPNAHERWVARSYTMAEIFHVPIDQMIREAPSGRKAIWASLAEPASSTWPSRRRPRLAIGGFSGNCRCPRRRAWTAPPPCWRPWRSPAWATMPCSGRRFRRSLWRSDPRRAPRVTTPCSGRRPNGPRYG